MEWEQIDKNHIRTKVFGGWLVKGYDEIGVCMTFVPDSMYAWKL